MLLIPAYNGAIYVALERNKHRNSSDAAISSRSVLVVGYYVEFHVECHVYHWLGVVTTLVSAIISSASGVPRVHLNHVVQQAFNNARELIYFALIID